MEHFKITPGAGLSGTALKTIALILMVLDHIYYMFSFTGAIPVWFSMLGRLSAPLFLFCLVEGFTHTHNRKKYFLKVYLISICMNGLLFFMQFGGLFQRPDGFFPANGMMTAFTLLMVMFQGMDWIGQKRWLRGFAAFLLPLVWPILANLLSMALPQLMNPIGLIAYTILPMWNSSLDASVTTMITGLLLYFFRKNRKLQVSAFALFTFLWFFVLVGHLFSAQPGFAWSQMFTTYYEWYGAFAALLMLCYNGKRGSGHQKFFYCFYPAHIYLLHAAAWGVWILLN